MLAHRSPDAEILPTTRIVEVAELLFECARHVDVGGQFDGRNLSAMGSLLRSTTLRSAERMILPTWCRDAMASHQSFSGLPTSPEAMAAIKATLIEGSF
jgi:hypothetical protein